MSLLVFMLGLIYVWLAFRFGVFGIWVCVLVLDWLFVVDFGFCSLLGLGLVKCVGFGMVMRHFVFEFLWDGV